MFDEFIGSCFTFGFLSVGIFISLKILSDFVTCIGIYHSLTDEKFLKKYLKILKYNFLLSLPFMFAFYIFIDQILPISDGINIFSLAAAATIVILINMRILANPTTHTRPIECLFHPNDDQEVSKIKERILSFYYAFISISVITIAIMVVHNQVFLSDSNVDIQVALRQEDILYSLISYCVILSIFTLLGECLLRFLDPIIKVEKTTTVVQDEI
jgi:small neutral amino acid transporter SnatA (MarC family)